MLIKNPINLLAKQTVAWDYLEDPQSPVDELGFGGGAGGGKTTIGYYVAIEILSTRVGRRNTNTRWTGNLQKYFGEYDEQDGWILKPIFLETFNPEKGHIYTRYWKPFKDRTMPLKRAFVRALASDNPHLPK